MQSRFGNIWLITFLIHARPQLKVVLKTIVLLTPDLLLGFCTSHFFLGPAVLAKIRSYGGTTPNAKEKKLLIHEKAQRQIYVMSYQCYDECYGLNYIQNRARYKDTWKKFTDAWNGYHNVHLRRSDHHLTTFITPFGRWWYTHYSGALRIPLIGRQLQLPL